MGNGQWAMGNGQWAMGKEALEVKTIFVNCLLYIGDLPAEEFIYRFNTVGHMQFLINMV